MPPPYADPRPSVPLLPPSEFARHILETHSSDTTMAVNDSSAPSRSTVSLPKPVKVVPDDAVWSDETTNTSLTKLAPPSKDRSMGATTLHVIARITASRYGDVIMFEAPQLIQAFRDKKAVELSASAIRIVADDYGDGVEEDGNARFGADDGLPVVEGKDQAALISAVKERFSEHNKLEKKRLKTGKSSRRTSSRYAGIGVLLSADSEVERFLGGRTFSAGSKRRGDESGDDEVWSGSLEGVNSTPSERDFGLC